LAKAPSPNPLGFATQPDSVSVGEALGFAADLFEERAVLFLEVFAHRLLMSVLPASDGHEEKWRLGCHMT
jgi:hypothetical protein